MNAATKHSEHATPCLMPCQSADVTNIGPLIEALTPRLLRYVERVFANCRASSADAADVVQEALLELFSGRQPTLCGFDAQHGTPLPAFAAVIARRRAIDHLRKTRQFDFVPEERAAEQDQSSSPESTVERTRRVQCLLDTLAGRLSPAGMDMFQRLYLSEQTPAEIERETGYSLAAIYQWRHRIRAVLVTA